MLRIMPAGRVSTIMGTELSELFRDLSLTRLASHLVGITHASILCSPSWHWNVRSSKVYETK